MEQIQNGKRTTTGHEPELTSTKTAIEQGLVFIELKEEVRARLELPRLVPIFKADLDNELAGGQIPAAAFAAGVEALKLVQPKVEGYDRFLARYYLLEAERLLQIQQQGGDNQADDYQIQRYFKKALDFNQDVISGEAAFYLAALVGPKDPEQAASLYRQSIELNPKMAAPHFELARLLRDRRDLPGALDEFETAYRLDPTSANLLSEVGDTHLMNNDLLRAQASYQRAIELEPEEWVLPVKLGIVDHDLSDFATAIRNLRTGLDLAPDELVEGFSHNLYVEGLYYLALSYTALGRPDQARKLYRAVLQINPQHEGALEGLG